MSEVFFYANGKATAHHGDFLDPPAVDGLNAGTVWLVASGPRGYEGRVFEVPVENAKLLGYASGRTEK